MHSADRWHSMSVTEQLANVGSEVSRALRARDAGAVQRVDGAVVRALELFDLSATDPRWNLHRRREILRAREEFCRLFYDTEVSAQSAASLNRYFLAFAASVRRDT